MDHHRTFSLSILVGVFQLEFFRQRHVELDRSALPGTVESIADMEVDFRAVKGAIAFIDLDRVFSIRRAPLLDPRWRSSQSSSEPIVFFSGRVESPRW